MRIALHGALVVAGMAAVVACGSARPTGPRLAAVPPVAANVCQAGSSCALECPLGGCVFVCAAGASCRFECLAGATCALACEGGHCAEHCDPGSQCASSDDRAGDRSHDAADDAEDREDDRDDRDDDATSN